jgi:hypothetical protein
VTMACGELRARGEAMRIEGLRRGVDSRRCEARIQVEPRLGVARGIESEPRRGEETRRSKLSRRDEGL